MTTTAADTADTPQPPDIEALRGQAAPEASRRRNRVTSTA